MLIAALESVPEVFEGRRGNYTGAPVSILLKGDAKPYWSKPYPIPLKNREATEKEVYRQCDIGAMREIPPEEISSREWAFPAFGTPKKKNGDMRLAVNFRQINPQLVRRVYPLPTIHEMLNSIMGFEYASNIDLKIGYIAIPVCSKLRKILNVILPFGIFKCLVLPQGIAPATDVFNPVW